MAKAIVYPKIANSPSVCWLVPSLESCFQPEKWSKLNVLMENQMEKSPLKLIQITRKEKFTSTVKQ